MFPVIHIGPLLLQTAGLALIVSFLIGSSLTERAAHRLALPAADISNGVFVALLAGLAAGRLVYAARYLSAYLADPLGLLSLNPSALAVPEGVVIGAVAGLYYWWTKGLPIRRTLDAIAPGLAALMLGLGVAHLASGAAYGAASQVPWAIYLWDAHRHPSQIYEIIAAALILACVLWRPADAFPGFRFLVWLTASAAARLFLEAFRGDSAVTMGGLRTAQLVAFAVLLLGLWLMGRSRANTPPPLEKSQPPPTGSPAPTADAGTTTPN